MSILAVTAQIEVKPAGAWVDITNATVRGSVRISGATTTNSDNPLASGASGDLTADLDVMVATGITIASSTPIRITYTTAGSAATRTFLGSVRDNQGNLTTAHLSCVSARETIATTRGYSVAFYRRRAFTQTTTTSQEDPTGVGYQAGLGNWGFWQSGGRPLEQSGSYPDAAFYYSVPQHSLIAPEWSWLAGESFWEQLGLLAEACGGQVYVARDGVVRYIQPLTYPSGSALFTFSRSAATYDQTSSGYFGPGSSYRFTSGQKADLVVCPYEPRVARPLQEVVSDDTVRQVPAGETIEIILEPKWPLKSLQYASGSATQLDPKAIVARFYDGQSAPQGASGYTHTVTLAAQRVTLTVTNASSPPIQITKIKLRGEPIVAGEPSSVTVGETPPARPPIKRTVCDGNPFVQSRSHALFLAELTLALHKDERMILNLTDCPPDVLRIEGETVNVTCAEWGLSAAPFLITGLDRDQTNGRNHYEAVSVAGLPADGDFF